MREVEPFNAVIASRVARLREENDLTVQQLAGRSLLSVKQVEGILAGEETISIDMIVTLAGALRVDPVVLVRGIRWIPDGEGGGEYRIPDRDG
jgi:transcriptional regulator with XRE-family HTH domain